MAVREMSIPLAVASAGQERLKQALAAAVITFLLTSLIVGIETVSSTGELAFNTRYKEVCIAAVAVFFGSIIVSYMREGNALPALVGGGGVTVVLVAILLLQDTSDAIKMLVPFRATIVNWGALIIPAAIAMRGLQMVLSARARADSTICRPRIAIAAGMISAPQLTMVARNGTSILMASLVSCSSRIATRTTVTPPPPTSAGSAFPSRI